MKLHMNRSVLLYINGGRYNAYYFTIDYRVIENSPVSDVLIISLFVNILFIAGNFAIYIYHEHALKYYTQQFVN